MKYRYTTLFVIIFSFLIHAQERGVYFSKKQYSPEPLPSFENYKNNLPRPVLENHKEWLDMYWKCWDLAFKGFKSPEDGSPLVSNWIDEAFSNNIFQWDTIFMIMFARYAHNVFPAVKSLDNFYALQRPSGYIGREYREEDGALIHFDFDGGLFSPKGYKNTINPPLFAWAEVESFKLTGDKSRFEEVYEPLVKYAEWLNKEGDPNALDWESNGRKSKDSKHGLYWNTPLGSGMDNTPRPANKGAGWVEMSAQMAIMYNNLSIIAKELNKSSDAVNFKNEAMKINENINKWCWNKEEDFYYDVEADGMQFKKKTVGAFWTLLAGTPNEEQAKRLISHLQNPNEFWRKIPFPSLSATEKEYRPDGGYWLGGVWAPTNLMIIKGLEKYGYYELARKASAKYLEGMYKVFADSGTVYENYAPDYFLPGNPAKPDFVGWSGIGPIQLLIENILGFEVDGKDNTLIWNITRTDEHGIYNLPVGSAIVNVLCKKRDSSEMPVNITVSTDSTFTLIVRNGSKTNKFKLQPGKHELICE